jgi:hypothetical protein
MESLSVEEKSQLTDLGTLVNHFAPMSPKDMYDVHKAAEKGHFPKEHDRFMLEAVLGALSQIGARLQVFDRYTPPEDQLGKGEPEQQQRQQVGPAAAPVPAPQPTPPPPVPSYNPFAPPPST